MLKAEPESEFWELLRLLALLANEGLRLGGLSSKSYFFGFLLWGLSLMLSLKAEPESDLWELVSFLSCEGFFVSSGLLLTAAGFFGSSGF